MAQLIKHYMVKKQSTWYLRQVSLMAASAWPSPQGLYVSHSPAIPNWNRVIATTEHVQREEKEKARTRERENFNNRFHPLSQDLVLQSIPGIVDWFETGCPNGVIVWQCLSECFTVQCLWVQGGTADHPTQGLSEGSMNRSKPQRWGFSLSGAWVLLEIGLWCSQWQRIRAKQQVKIIYLPLCDLWM